MDEKIRRAHEKAQKADEGSYRDPKTGRWVMTASYLRNRGYCCFCECRHCPYPEGPHK